MIKPSTFSIVAYDPVEKCWGIAVASKFPAVGAVVPWAKAGCGAIATQASANTTFGPNGLAYLSDGLTAEETFQHLREQDPGIESRQVGIVDRTGGSFTFTGKDCFDWAGGIARNGYAIQGNILTGGDVVEEIETKFLHSEGELVDRLVLALKAGEEAGGDKRGKQSAAILVVKENGGYGGFNDRMVDYRVDDHPEPVARLIELTELYHLYFEQSPPSEKLDIDGEIKVQLRKILESNSYLRTTDPDNFFVPALRAMTGNENFEDRIDLDGMKIDKPVYQFLARRFNQ